MPVQVSYKKQFVFFILLIVIFLATIEVLVNIWLYFIYRCDFEDNEIFEDVSPEIKRKLCHENIGLENIRNDMIMAEGTRGSENLERKNVDENIIFINSEGFRSPEFSKEKLENTYRIFVLGGSTTFGVGVLDNQTYSFFLQKLYHETNLGFNVEVVNAGWVSLSSPEETNLIKKRLVNYEPDLFIVYDGINELNMQVIHKSPIHSPVQWKDRWLEICELGKQRDFDTLIILQPFVGVGNKILTFQESRALSAVLNSNRLEPYPSYIEQLDELKTSCTLTADLTDIFDNIKEPIYFDVAHTGIKGNQIIAEKIYALSLPLVKKRVASNDSILSNGTESSGKLDSKYISASDINTASEEFSFTLKDVISLYKTPKIFPLIFD